MLARSNGSLLYWLAVIAAGLAALIVCMTPLATQIDNYGADWLFRLHRPEPWTPQSAILAMDDDSYNFMNGTRDLRGKLAQALRIVSRANPRAIAIDVVLSDAADPEQNQELASAIRGSGKVVLFCELLPGGRWQFPILALREAASGLGHVHAAPDEQDGISRHMPLAKSGNRERYWALSLESYRLARNVQIVETPDSLDVGELIIPASRRKERLMRIRYLPPDADGASRIPHVSLKNLIENPALANGFRDKVVFVGATAQSATRDRLMTPYHTSMPMPGVEIHAHAYETLAQGKFLLDASPSVVWLLSLISITSAGFIFLWWSGLRAYLLGAALLAAAHLLPHLFFWKGVIYPYSTPVLTAWFAVACAAVFQYFRTRDQLAIADGERSRYQQAIQFVTHEMRTPLSAIQGSSELMNRYQLPEEKQKQLSRQIHSESKRLARMIQTFLDVERLSAGHMELKREPFGIAGLLASCVERVRPIAERKSITVTLAPPIEATITGDRELMEYAIYNLLTNAVKYSPAGTHVEAEAYIENAGLRVDVKDEGMGMTADELKNIGRKFYRTRKAEQSGEAGTGIGLSIVQQIIAHHGGSLRVASSPGKGSCFTMLVPAAVQPVSAVPATEN